MLQKVAAHSSFVCKGGPMTDAGYIWKLSFLLQHQRKQHLEPDEAKALGGSRLRKVETLSPSLDHDVKLFCTKTQKHSASCIDKHVALTALRGHKYLEVKSPAVTRCSPGLQASKKELSRAKCRQDPSCAWRCSCGGKSSTGLRHIDVQGRGLRW